MQEKQVLKPNVNNGFNIDCTTFFDVSSFLFLIAFVYVGYREVHNWDGKLQTMILN